MIDPVRAGDLSHRVEPFCKVLVKETPFGTLAAVRLPEGMEPVSDAELRLLHAEERSFARTLRGRRQIEWVGGRLALRLASAARSLALGPVLPGPKGEPLLPPGVAASISPQRGPAAALVGAGPATLGLDIEELAPARPAIAPRILDDEERAAWERLPAEARWTFLVRRFSLKEATYKAIYPHLRRFVGFHEAHVARAETGDVSIFLRSRPADAALVLEADCFEDRNHVWAMVRARPAEGSARMEKIRKSDEEWKKELSPEAYRILRQGGTEPPGTGELLHNKESGLYLCGACGLELFNSTSKYDSGSGWPSFWAPIDSAHVEEHEDLSHGMRRTEIRCARCDSHLGHVFPDGPPPSGLRYCVNSASLKFKKS